MINLDFNWQTSEFMLYCRTSQLREKSMMAYEQSLKLFERWCMEEMGIYTVDKVTENVIRRYIIELQERGKYTFYINDKQKKKNYPERRRDFRQPVSTATINNYIRNIRVFFNWLERNYFIKKNPMKRIRQLKTNRQPKVYLTDDELRKLLANLDRSYFSEHRDYMMILLMLDSGMRLGECSTLIGMKYGHWNEEGLKDQKGVMAQKSMEFKQKYREMYTSNNCKELLGYDVTVPEEFQQAVESGRLFTFCPQVVKNVVEILEEMI